MFKKNRKSINTQFLLILMVLIIPLNIISLAISFIMIHDADVFHEIAIESILDKYVQSIDSTIDNSNLLLYEFTQGHYSEYTPFFNGANTLEYSACRNLLSQRLLYRRGLCSMADYIFLYQTRKDDLLIIPSGSESLKEFLTENDYFSGADINRKNIWNIVQVEETNYLIRVGYSGDVYLGAYIDLDAVMEELCKELSFTREQITLTNSNAGEMENKVISAKCENANLFISVPKVQSFSFLSVWRIGLFLFALAGLFLIPGLFLLLKRTFIQPLLIMNHAHKQLEEGKESYRIESKSNTSEFETAYQSFNNMASSLQDLRLENINKELAHTKMLLDNLQLQIRPHFLLNNMNLLYTLIQSKKEESAKQLILYLSEYFRYLFQYQNSLELFSKEFSLILQYIEVAKSMYPDEFTFSYDFDPEINMIRIPPLLMHNFVENILSHALIHNHIVHIMFIATYENGQATIQIADDGCGIKKDEVERINSGNYDDYARGKYVGVRNSIKRLQYFYKGRAALQVESSQDEGTVFTITIPYNLEKEGDQDELTAGQ